MTSTTFPPKKPLGRRVRALMLINRGLVRIGLLPTSDKAGELPIAKRLALKPPAWAVLPPSAPYEVEDVLATGRHGDIPIRVYRPAGGVTSPMAVLYVHGGGFTVGGLDSLDWFCRELAIRGGHAVASVQYRLAPDFRFPIPLDDVTDALGWLQEQLGELGASQIAIAGDSAGGNLAAVAAIRARDAGASPIRTQVLIYPGLDATFGSPSYGDRAGGLTRRDIEATFTNYAGDEDRRNPEVSPIFSTNLAGLPDTLVITADHDLLRDEGRLYSQALSGAGVPSRWIEVAGVDHGFLSVPVLTRKESLSILGEVLEALR